MRAIDTNIIVRLLTGDDPGQAQKARALFAEGDLFIPTSVLLETEWVLRSAYGFEVRALVAAFRKLGGLPGVSFEDSARVARALDWTEQGMDFADALHLACADGCAAFVSFDRKFAKMASKLAETKVLAL